MISETAPPTGCSSGQVLGWDGSTWQCITPSVTVDNALCNQITGHNCGYDTDTDTAANTWTSSITGCVSKTDWGGWVTGTLTCDAGSAMTAISQCWNGAQFFTCGITCCKLK